MYYHAKVFPIVRGAHLKLLQGAGHMVWSGAARASAHIGSVQIGDEEEKMETSEDIHILLWDAVL